MPKEIVYIPATQPPKENGWYACKKDGEAISCEYKNGTWTDENGKQIMPDEYRVLIDKIK
jgi:frataxin-like iron-binding protein CyaY